MPVGEHDRLLARVCHEQCLSPPLSGFSVGYEARVWRAGALTDRLMEDLPGFALTYSERESFTATNAVRRLRKAATKVYSSEKYQRRGEFGELLLHTLLTMHFGSLPAVSKIYYKDGPNETVKGFDAVHVVPDGEGLELWLGEVKFYERIDLAVAHVVKELIEHSRRDYLRDEFIAITDKIDPKWPHGEKLRLLLDPDVSLDFIFREARFPVLLTYDSSTVASFEEVSGEYLAALREELAANHDAFLSKDPPMNIKVELLLLPLESKKALVKALHEKLRTWQSI